MNSSFIIHLFSDDLLGFSLMAPNIDLRVAVGVFPGFVTFLFKSYSRYMGSARNPCQHINLPLKSFILEKEV